MQGLECKVEGFQSKNLAGWVLRAPEALGRPEGNNTWRVVGTYRVGQ